MLTPQQIREAESEVNALQERINETFLHRSESPEARERWQQACASWHARRSSTDVLWEDSTREAIRTGDLAAIEDAIVFLEIDPWFFRSGYLKERVISDLRRAPLSTRQLERLRHVIIEVCRERNRREFRYYCALALAIWSVEFESDIRSEAGTHDLESKGKFSYLLRYLEQHRKNIEPGASPNGGPSQELGNSGVPEGPPSVS